MECENVKKILSSTFEGIVFVNDFYVQNDLSKKITRTKFEELSKNIFDKLLKPINSVLEYKKLNPNEIKEIILVGSSSKIPKIKTILLLFKFSLITLLFFTMSSYFINCSSLNLF